MENTNALSSEKLLELERLSAKVDSLQHQVDSATSFAQAVMQGTNNYLMYTSILVGAFTLVLAGAALFLQWWYAKNRKKYITKTGKDLEKSITKGVLPGGSEVRAKLIKVILSSDEFHESLNKVRRSYKLKNESEIGKEELYSRAEEERVEEDLDVKPGK